MTEQLTVTELDELRELLLEKRRLLREDMLAMEHELAEEEEKLSADSSSIPTHLADAGSELFDRDANADRILRQRARLLQVEEAIRRLEQGNYGLCQADGHPIEKKRLHAKPWARYCLDHAKENGLED